MDPSSFLDEEALNEEDRVRNQWISETPHQPTSDLEEALTKAAYPAKDSRGLVILTSGEPGCPAEMPPSQSH